MPFCGNCGTKLADDARFCTGCGQPQIPGASPAAPAAPVVPKLEYTIQGENLQMARVKLKPGQELYAEAGRMIYKTPAIDWQTQMSGDSITDKLWGAVKRRLMGQSLFLTFFRAQIEGEIGFAGSYPGRIQVFDLAPGQSVMVERDSFLFAQSTVQLDIALVKRLGTGFFGGEGFILEKLTGPGAVFIHGGGDFVEFQLAPGEVLQVDTGCIVAFDEGVDYDIQMVGSIRTALFGGEGLFLATLRGPGRVIIQSMTLEKMRRELAPAHTGGDEHRGLDALSGLFDQD
ncbi:MAG: TIGR00266 family protein [Bryobacteraceae bacterium]